MNPEKCIFREFIVLVLVELGFHHTMQKRPSKWLLEQLHNLFPFQYLFVTFHLHQSKRLPI